MLNERQRDQLSTTITGAVRHGCHPTTQERLPFACASTRATNTSFREQHPTEQIKAKIACASTRATNTLPRNNIRNARSRVQAHALRTTNAAVQKPTRATPAGTTTTRATETSRRVCARTHQNHGYHLRTRQCNGRPYRVAPGRWHSRERCFTGATPPPKSVLHSRVQAHALRTTSAAAHNHHTRDTCGYNQHARDPTGYNLHTRPRHNVGYVLARTRTTVTNSEPVRARAASTNHRQRKVTRG